jgi:hypothetical protein
MAKYLVNTTNSIYLYKAGYIEVPPKTVKPVTDVDFNSGIFEEQTMTDQFCVFDTKLEAEVFLQSLGPVKSVPADIGSLANLGAEGASTEELAEFLATTKAKQDTAVSKYAPYSTPNPDPTPVEVPVEAKIETVDSVDSTPPTSTTKTRAKKEVSTPAPVTE